MTIEFDPANKSTRNDESDVQAPPAHTLTNVDDRLTLDHLLPPRSWDLPGLDGMADTDDCVVTKLDDLDTSLALLRRYRNTLRSIHRLSTDILVIIFLELSSAYDVPLQWNFGSCPWIYLAHVCRRWRSIALSCPLLWTCISTRYPTAALASLDRSVDAPLSFVVHSDANSDHSKPVLDRMLSHMGRVRAVYLPCNLMKTTNGGIHARLSPLIGTHAPSVQTIHVYKACEPWIRGDCFPLPKIFDTHTPRLTTLKLNHSYPTVGSSSFSNLKELYIKGRKSHTPSVELARFLDLLAACPFLEVVVTSKAQIDPSQDTSNSERRQISLEHLRRIDLARCSATVVSDLISRLVIPDCTMRFSVWLEKRDDSHFLFGIPDVLEDWHHLHDIKQLFIKYRSASRCIMIEGTTSRNTFQITAFIHSDTEFGGMSKISGPLIHSIADTLDMSLVEELTIQETAYHRPPLTFTRDAWTHLLEKMPLLKKLHIRWGRTSNGGCCREILSALTTPHIDTGALLCPVLERFTLRYDKSWSSLQFHRLAQERSSRKQPLKWLSVRSSHYQDVEIMEDTDLGMLREVVEIVDLEPPLIESAVFPTVEW